MRRATLLLALVGSLATGCFTFVPANRPLEEVDLKRGYRPMSTARKDAGDTWMFLAFSGGGTRAAAFAYGVLEELRDTPIVIDGQPARLLDEVDGISGVSGGSFPTAYYGLFGDRVFDELPERFLYKNVQRALVLRTLNPWNLMKLATPLLSRTDLASRYYDEHIFEGATFADLATTDGPNVHINATDLSQGNRISFNQDGFDSICSDLDDFPIAAAVAASSAVPVLLSALTLENYSGTCGYELPEIYYEALQQRETNPRGYRTAEMARQYLDAEAKRYIHLIDGGISDNLGLRVPIERVAVFGSMERYQEALGLDPPRHLVVIAVNAETTADPKIDLTYGAPSLAMSMNLVSGAQIRHYNFETLQLMGDMVDQWSRSLSESGRPVTGYFIEVSFDLLPDADDRQYFKRLPTSFSLSEEQVDRLREAGRQLLRQSWEYQEMLQQLR